MSKFVISGPNSALTAERLQEILKSAYQDFEVSVGAGNAAVGDDNYIEINHLNDEVEDLTKKLEASEATATKALASIQTFHKQQKALFDEFVLLRQRYDDQKNSLLDILWGHCARHHPDLRQIPDLEDASTFVEREDRVGKYDVGDVLGEGQFATVKECHMTGYPDQELALKIVNKDQIATFLSLRRMNNEIGTLKRLQSPHIVRITDCFQTNKFLYLVTERGGFDLFCFFDEHPDGVAEDWAREIIVCIFRAVFFCHSQGICHRDLKPENILLDFDPDTAKCIDLKLCDFGLSTSYLSNSADRVLTDFCGSPGFFAPEMITEGRYYGDKVDIWSVGCILLELVLGHQRFCDSWMAAYDYEILQDKPKFKHEIAHTVSALPNHLQFSDDLNDFVLNILNLDVEKRSNSQQICKHAWVIGQLDTALVHKPLVIDPSGSNSPIITQGMKHLSVEMDPTSGLSARPPMVSLVNHIYL